VKPVLLLITLTLSAFAADVAVRREGSAFRAAGLPATPPDGGWAAVFRVHVGDASMPPVMGTYAVEGADVVFRPRFAIPPDVACRAIAGGKEFRFAAAAREFKSTTRVLQVFPSGGDIPANQLKFYLEFSAPMEKGQAWERIRLLNAEGKVVELAFLEIDQELWDPESKRLTLLFDPGRIKRGVMPRDQVGSALLAGQSYTLVVDREYRDAEGNRLIAEFRRGFRVRAEDREPVDPSKWSFHLPLAGTREPLRVAFGEPLDAALATRLIGIEGIPGDFSLANAESTLVFTPSASWESREYKLLVDTALEDLAGNRVGRPFDVDTFNRITVRTNRGVVAVPFRIR
jgi:hypothetical protein